MMQAGCTSLQGAIRRGSMQAAGRRHLLSSLKNLIIPDRGGDFDLERTSAGLPAFVLAEERS
jgi:hypothetical protein